MHGQMLMLASLSSLGFLGFHHTPWWLIGLVLTAAIVSRSLTLLISMWRRKD